ncbi:FAD-dependent oxidoreductase [Thermosynechococcaceae cyanobacterium BACA0444]|uniref:FAD-dependent oxidoreductase n=1 Tax=Pseudocalidococcus azoricus BACA0444 TaxID=2918990 RepID=A0AAE4FT94_9CYAN|nr:FAD-dependent oxidoreductase [Pseudocalidococcus azoricus]MDS3861127.1 FAD-dependent oxidoreductase [Pseudocalidococcus azoricus BACA0444]
MAQNITCDILVVGGGLAGVAATYEALLAGKTVCLTELTDWLGGQISAQGTAALDERPRQRELLYFPRGYNTLRQRLIAQAKNPRPGDCWVSEVCFLPQAGHEIISQMLTEAEKEGKGKLHLFLNTVPKELTIQPVGNGEQIQTLRAIQHQPAANAPPLNTFLLSQILKDIYTETDSVNFMKKIIQFTPPPNRPWIVIEATETGELLGLADLPYKLGIDPVDAQNPSSSSKTPYPYCPQAFTYTFAMEATATPQDYTKPEFYPQFEPFYSFDLPRYALEPELVFTYRRIHSAKVGQNFRSVTPGDISMQNWGGGNDYGPGNATDNWIYTRAQLQAKGQLNPGGWLGGIRAESLAGGENLALGYFYWLWGGTTDSKLTEPKRPNPYLRYLSGLDSPMGTAHGLSKFPYVREGRRLIGRYASGWPQGFQVNEVDISRKDYAKDPYYQTQLPPELFQDLSIGLGGLQGLKVMTGELAIQDMAWRTRARLYPDSVGIGHYPIDFHPCMLKNPPEKPGNIERPGERQGAAETYPFQIPLRAMIPPRIDNLIATGKNIAVSHIAAAAYRVQAYEWSAGAGAGTAAAFVLKRNLLPPDLIQPLPLESKPLAQLQQHLIANDNPIAFPRMSIFNDNWQAWP